MYLTPFPPLLRVGGGEDLFEWNTSLALYLVS
jgi:hypothetical protein